jgi:hypothetical protein
VQIKRNRLALLGILTLALSVTVGLTVDGAVAAKKKKGGGGGSKTFSKGSAPIPDAKFNCLDTDANGQFSDDCQSNGGSEFDEGVLVSKIVVGKKFLAAKIKDLNVQVEITHGDISDLDVYLVGPRGGFVYLYNGVANNAVPLPANTFNTKLGPTVFDDQALLNVNDQRSATDPPANPANGSEAFAPYAGSFKPVTGTLASLGGKLFGTWYLIVRDFDAYDGPTGSPEGIQTGVLNGWKLIGQLKGGGGGKKKKK